MQSWVVTGWAWVLAHWASLLLYTLGGLSVAGPLLVVGRAWLRSEQMRRRLVEAYDRSDRDR